MKRNVIAAIGRKLHNRRVAVYKLGDDGEGDFLLLFRKLNEDRKPEETQVLLSAEAMEAVVHCYIDIVEDEKAAKRRGLGLHHVPPGKDGV